MRKMKRVAVVVLDGCGAGWQHDAARYGDEGANTLKHVLEQAHPDLPNLTDLGLMKIDFDQTYWTHGSDGYYYYKTALQPGAVTEPLFASVSFDISMDNKYQNSTAKVDVTVYAVQTANNGSSAFEAKGWPEE